MDLAEEPGPVEVEVDLDRVRSIHVFPVPEKPLGQTSLGESAVAVPSTERVPFRPAEAEESALAGDRTLVFLAAANGQVVDRSLRLQVVEILVEGRCSCAVRLEVELVDEGIAWVGSGLEEDGLEYLGSHCVR